VVDEFAGTLLQRIRRAMGDSVEAAAAHDWFGEEVALTELEDLRRLAAEHGLQVAVP
jgi:hypothetical protein